MPLAIIDGPTIMAGESLSKEGVDCSAGEIVRITVPQEYTQGNMPHAMTFQVSTDGNFYNDLFDADGVEITIVARADTGIVVNKPWTRSIAFLKIRSGTRDAPVRQKEDCKLAVAILTP
jgi:hypothetical protein